ncbi:collagenase-like [Lucilia sericata]|uniref:collagenase-like n=1 Tax=Lucilia sericata TaxID=13632 RepID=UPI0018A84CDA|nr:collagenase-like [Lucilia sericata]
MNPVLYKVSILLILYRLCVLHVLDVHAVVKLFNKRNDKMNIQMQSEAIISGSRAALGQFPWHVILRRDEEDTLLCGGSIISNKWVLTASHCIYNLSSVLLTFGTIDLFNYENNMTSTKLYTYPDFDAENIINDISLIELPTPLNFTKNIKSIGLVSSIEASNDFVGAEGIIIGFGQTANIAEDSSDVLLWANVEIINITTCAKAYEEESIEDTVMCGIGYNNNADISPCDGDSGGALVWKNKYNNYVQIGIISFTVKNKCSEYPTGYTKITSYLNYINNITGLNFD